MERKLCTLADKLKLVEEEISKMKTWKKDHNPLKIQMNIYSDGASISGGNIYNIGCQEPKDKIVSPSNLSQLFGNLDRNLVYFGCGDSMYIDAFDKFNKSILEKRERIDSEQEQEQDIAENSFGLRPEQMLQANASVIHNNLDVNLPDIEELFETDISESFYKMLDRIPTSMKQFKIDFNTFDENKENIFTQEMYFPSNILFNELANNYEGLAYNMLNRRNNWMRLGLPECETNYILLCVERIEFLAIVLSAIVNHDNNLNIDHEQMDELLDKIYFRRIKINNKKLYDITGLRQLRETLKTDRKYLNILRKRVQINANAKRLYLIESVYSRNRTVEIFKKCFELKHGDIKIFKQISINLLKEFNEREEKDKVQK